ncbi:MAG: AAA family ATPase [Desulfuromonas sp.]|nr:MAG: AAA family ATPase [Desulfuromonas sp.]
MSIAQKNQDREHREAIQELVDLLSHKYLQGKVKAIKLTMASLLAGGHVLLEDIPGLGKTTLALSIAKVLGLSFGRIQCTSDLLPSDITGLSVFDREENRFRFVKGPIFHHVVLVDEINRAMPKTQSALLEAMEERRVTVDGVTYQLPEPFMVIATQNPMEQVGTFPLPESQLDRFLITTDIGYPPAEMEKAIIRQGSIREKLEEIEPQFDGHALLACRHEVEQVYLGEKVADYLFNLVEATRSHRLVQTGISTRGAISLASASRANAFLSGRDFVIPEDVQKMLWPVAGHRLLMREDSSESARQEVLESLRVDIPVPLV